MRPSVMTGLLTVTEHDSGALGGTAAIAHPLGQAGDWELVVGRAAGLPLATVELRVRDDAASSVAAVDLSATDRAGRSRYAGEPVDVLSVRTGGYVRLQALEVGGALYALLRPSPTSQTPGLAAGGAPWDSRVLQARDLFVCLPLRPGRYTLANQLGNSRCAVTVRYPDPRHNRGTPPPQPEPVQVRCGNTFAPESLVLTPGQGLIVEVHAQARVTLTLDAPDDGPPDLAAWRAAHDAEVLRTLARAVPS